MAGRTSRSCSSSTTSSRSSDAGPIVAELLRDAPGLSVLVTSRARAPRLRRAGVPGARACPTPPDLSQLTRARARQPARPRSGPSTPRRCRPTKSVRLFIARADGGAAGLPGHERERPGRRRDRGAPARHAARDRARGGAGEALLARRAPRPAGGPAQPPLRRRARPAGAAADAARRDRLELRPARRGAPPAARPPVGVRRAASTSTPPRPCAGRRSELGMDVVDGLVALADQSLIRTRRDRRRAALPDARHDPRVRRREARRRAGEAERIASAGTAPGSSSSPQRLAPELAGDDQRSLARPARARARQHPDRARPRDRRAGMRTTAIGAGVRRLAVLAEARPPVRGAAPARRDGRGAVVAHATRPCGRGCMEALGGVVLVAGRHPGDGRGLRARPSRSGAALGDKARARERPLQLLVRRSACPDRTRAARSTATSMRPARAARVLEEALALYRELGDERGEANVLWGMGNKQVLQRRPRRRRRGVPARRSRGSARSATGRWRRGRCTWSAAPCSGREQPDESRPYLQHALRHFYDAGDAAGITLVLDDLSSQALADEEPERAARLWGAAGRWPTATGADAGRRSPTAGSNSGCGPNVRNRARPGRPRARRRARARR